MSKKNLTQDELAVLKCIALGNSSVVIADVLTIPSRDINRHMSNILKKLNVSDPIGTGVHRISFDLI